MSQKLKDVWLLIQRDRRAKFALIGGALLVVMFFTLDGQPRKRGARKKEAAQELGTGAMGNSEAYNDLISRFNTEVDGLKTQSDEMRRVLEDQRKHLSDYEARTAEIFRKIIERISDDRQMIDAGGFGNGLPPQSLAGSPAAAGTANSGADSAATGGFGGAAGANWDADGSTAPGMRSPRGVRPAVASAPVGPDGLPISQASMQMGGAGDSSAAGLAPGMATDEGFESFGMEDVEVAPPAPPAPPKVAYISAGDSVRVKLLSGVNAPTNGTPYPVVFSLDGTVTGPDGSAMSLGGARLVAAAQGSLPDSRALFRLTDLSVRLPSGQRKVIKVDGWVVGEDGIRGMSGVLIDPLGRAIAGATFTGALQGFGRAARDQQSTIVVGADGNAQSYVTGDAGRFAAGTAITQGAQQWSDLIRQRLDQLVPQVQVRSGRQATAIFSKSVTVDGLIEELGNEEVTYASLD